MVDLAVIFPPDRFPEELRQVVSAAEQSGLPELWLWEDCFKESGIATAAAALAWTDSLRIGIGLLPVPLRNVALTAMEIATLARLFPGRLTPGVGHGVLDWMAQVGARAPSPMTLLGEYTTALRELLHGREVSTTGSYISLDAVRLDWPPEVVPPLLVGGVGPRTLELAGERGDGVILTGDTTLEALPVAVEHAAIGRRRAGREGPMQVVVFLAITDRPDPEATAALINDYAAEGATTVALLSVGDAPPPLPDFIRFVAEEVRHLV